MAQPQLLLTGQRESDALPAHEHKTRAIMTYLVAQGWRKPAPTGAGVAQVRADWHREWRKPAPTGAGAGHTCISGPVNVQNEKNKKNLVPYEIIFLARKKKILKVGFSRDIATSGLTLGSSKPFPIFSGYAPYLFQI